MNEFLLIDKPGGATSQSIDRAVKKFFGTKHVGHAGTLDPFASGVLPIAVGRATKFIDFLTDDKSYRAELLFGISTDTADRTGQTIAQLDDFIMPTVDQLSDAIRSFVGTIEQTPPKFSAIKLNGRKAYDLARRSIDFEIPTRLVTIDRIDLVSIDNRSVILDIDCRKGTYIRSLAVDIGKKLGLPVTLNNLRRTRSSGFSIEQSSIVENIRAESIITVERALNHLPSIEINKNRRRAFLNGLTTTVASVDRSSVRVMCDGEFLGVGALVNRELKATKLFLTT